jgi:hypothetical protein
VFKGTNNFNNERHFKTTYLISSQLIHLSLHNKTLELQTRTSTVKLKPLNTQSFANIFLDINTKTFLVCTRPPIPFSLSLSRSRSRSHSLTHTLSQSSMKIKNEATDFLRLNQSTEAGNYLNVDF